MWSHQYLQQQDQIAARTMSPNPFPSNGAFELLVTNNTKLITWPVLSDYSNVFGLEPKFHAALVGYTTDNLLLSLSRLIRDDYCQLITLKFIPNAFVVTADKSTLLQVYLGPFDVRTTLRDGAHAGNP